MTPLHRVRFTWGGGQQIEIEAMKGRGEAAPLVAEEPSISFVERETEPDSFTLRGIPSISWRNDTPPLFEPFQLREHTQYFVDITLPISRAEAEAQYLQRPAWPFAAARLATVFRADPPRRWRQTENGHVIVSGTLRLKNHAGIIDLRTDFDTPLVAEVVCRKIDYLKEFQTLLDEVAAQMAELLLQYDSPLSFAFNISDVASESEAALLFQMRHIMSYQNLPLAVEEVFTSFHSRLVERFSAEDVSRIEEIQIEHLVDDIDLSAFGRGGPLSRLFRGSTPQELSVSESIETVDTLENRYVKYFLEECLLVAHRLAHQLQKRQKPAAVRESQGWVSQLEEMLGRRVWADVGPLQQFPSNSQVLQRRRGYRDILKYDLSLRLGLELSWKRGAEFADGLLGDVRPVNEIYEYWCFFVMRRVLAELCESELLNNGSFIAVSADGLQVRLERGKRSRVTFVYKSDGPRKVHVSLFYNRRFKRPSRPLRSWDGSYTAFFDPDYSVLVTVEDGATTRRHWLHFDAKYRMEVAEVESLFSSGEEGGADEPEGDGSEYDQEISRIHKQDDLFKMHTYRDGILSSRGAYILFPGDGSGMRMSGKAQNFFVRHPSAFSGTPAHNFPSVGAFDLCPGRDDKQTGAISDFLRSVFQGLSEGETYQEETGPFK